MNSEDFDIEVIGAATPEEYLDLILVDHENHEGESPIPIVTAETRRKSPEG